MKNSNKSNLVRAAIISSLVVAGPVAAQTDTTAATAALADAAVAIGVIGAAILTTKGAMIVFPWVLRMMGKS